jgi:hypothetical protein
MFLVQVDLVDQLLCEYEEHMIMNYDYHREEFIYYFSIDLRLDNGC